MSDSTSPVLDVIRFNWPRYAVALVGAVLLVLARPLGDAISFVAAALIASITVGSLVVSHVVYGMWALDRIVFGAHGDGSLPRRIGFAHVGHLGTIERLRPSENTEIATFDFRGIESPSTPSARRAVRRERGHGQPLADPPPTSVDRVVFAFSAHEFRRRRTRIAAIRSALEVAPDGDVVIVEHERCVATFLAFGPGALHFFSRRAWVRVARDAGATIDVIADCWRFATVYRLTTATPHPN